MFEGRSAVALDAARRLVREMPEDVATKLRFIVDDFIALPLHVLVRFGRWDDILREPKPAADLPLTTAFWHYARAVALSVTGRVEPASRELAELERAVAAVPEEWLAGNNPARRVIAVAVPMARGELLFRKGETEAAFASLREAQRLDESLHYSEPWGWIQPVAHALGALLLQAGRVEEAEAVYRRDLERHPGNGWALHGLAECLRRGGREEEARKTEAAFRKAWARADIELPGSCFCRTVPAETAGGERR
jgi:tetratricopeptide (TPR) repeat protein